MKRQLKSKKGSALITVLIFLLVMSVLGTGAIAISMTETNLTEAQEHKVQARYLAQSGAQAVAEYMISNPDLQAEDLIGKVSDIESPMADGQFQVSVSDPDASGFVTITSTGTYKGISQESQITLSSTGSGVGNIFEHVIATKDGFTVDKNANLKGVFILGSVATANETFDESTLKDFSYQILEDASLSQMFVPINENAIPDDAIDLVFEKNQDQTISLTNGEERHYISSGSSDFKEKFSVIGDGVVHLYLDGDLTISGNGIIEVQESAMLLIYVIGAHSIQFVGNSSIQGPILIYAPESTIVLNNAKLKLEGAFYAKDLLFMANAEIKQNKKIHDSLNQDVVVLPDTGITFTGYKWSN